MASSRKKQDEKNLKTLRELGALPQNKYCFDCNQRGPTYVDMTIGSFVCTKCSGMLRGLTPPHRVKSISMATFTGEEIDLLKSRGNDYCRSVWLGLYEGASPPGPESRDEQTVKDFMVDKYERKRYYLDPAQALKNGYKPSETSSKIKPLSTLISDPKPIKLNGNVSESTNRKRPEVKNSTNHTSAFAVNFDNADIFANNNNNNNNTRSSAAAQQQQQQQQQQQESFANFEDNPVFGSTNNSSMPTPTAFDNFNLAQSTNYNKVPAAPPQDKYAALKDLDNALKQNRTEQTSVDWNSSGSNGSLYSSPTPSGSVYSSPSPQSSMFGSPSQGQFMNAFQSQENAFSNPFNGSNGLNWASNGNGNFSNGQAFANPFREPVRSNGFAQNFQPALFPVTANGSTWGANPFKVGATTNSNSNNPFL